MRKIEELLKEVNSVKIDHSVIRNKNGQIWVEFLNGRQQRIFIDRKHKYYKIWSVVLPKSWVDSYGDVNLIEYLWSKNKQTELVGFYLDKKERLVGSVIQLAETIDYEELIFYIQVLARECDRLEFLLSGKDIN